MNAALNLLDDLSLDVSRAAALMVEAEGKTNLASAGLEKLALDELTKANEHLESVRKEIERRMYGADLNSRCVAELIEAADRRAA